MPMSSKQRRNPQNPSEWVCYNLFYALWYYYQEREEVAEKMIAAALWWSKQKSEEQTRAEVLAHAKEAE